jgi:hypothetical protein
VSNNSNEEGLTMLKKIYNFLLLIFCCLLSIHCFSISSFAQKGFKVEKVDGVIVVSNPEKPIPKNGLKKRIVFKEELSIGEIEGDENYMFSEFIRFNTDDEGNFYVSDVNNYRIQKYDVKGKYSLTIGRKGQGPGEFESLSIPRFNKDNSLFVFDWRNRRISFFDYDGNLLKEISTQIGLGYVSINSKGRILAINFKRIKEGNSIKGLERLTMFDGNFNAIKILYETDREPFVTITGGDINKQIKTFANLISKTAFQPSLRYKMTDEDVIYFGYTNKYEINICSPEGKLKKRIIRGL